MTNVLLVTSSPRGGASYSAQVAQEFAKEIEGAKITVRDLSAHPLPHIAADFVQAAYTPDADRSPAQRQALALSDKLIAELQAADVVVVAAGMINFGVPSTLKAWIDHVARAGVTFRYGPSGPEGLLTGKKTFLLLATGGVYSSGAYAPYDHLTPYLNGVLGFLGLTDVETVLIEGVGAGPEATEKALVGARSKAASLATAFAA
ncbi:MAG: NAD(P)H-dependent oxidoreductase [Capsulimonadaceae bacterium]|nr:NAD(P)H-dependent oxidoreductase [Capsulimonadaceae bacterium]